MPVATRYQSSTLVNRTRRKPLSWKEVLEGLRLPLPQIRGEMVLGIGKTACV